MTTTKAEGFMPDTGVTLKKVAFLSIMGEPGRYGRDLFCDAPGGDDEVHWIKLLFEKMGVSPHIDYVGRYVARDGDPLPAPDEVDIAILGGSFHSVTENTPWQQRVWAWMNDWRAAGKPLLGICGGHQMMGVMHGSPVTEVENGPLAASLPVEVTDEGAGHWLFEGFDRQPVFHFGNYEHLAPVPEGVTVLASRPDVPAAALDYGNGWVSVQFHPEADEVTFALSWGDTNPEYADGYRPLPDAPKLIANFLKCNGVPL